ncbi:MAG: hypothetical protein ACRDHU_04115 [Actinomycetota bacterium]
MFDSLEGAWEKFRWAQQHFDALREAVSQQINSVTIQRDEGLEATDDPEVFFLNWRVVELSDMPPEWGLRVGDIVHNLRSAMDYIAWQLGWWNQGGTPFGKTAFPICGNATLFNNKRWVLKSLSEEHVALIESCQPYQGGNREWPFLPLADLRDLSDQDKHRVLVVTQPVVSGQAFAKIQQLTGCERAQAHFLAGYPLHVGAAVVRVKVWKPTGEFDVEMEYTSPMYVGLSRELGDGGFYIQDMPKVLRDMTDAVDLVLKRCEPAFKGLPFGLA